MNVEVIDCEIIEPSKAFIPQYHSREGLELREIVLWVASVVRLQ